MGGVATATSSVRISGKSKCPDWVRRHGADRGLFAGPILLMQDPPHHSHSAQITLNYGKSIAAK